MDPSGTVPSGSNVKPQQLVPRQITIEILGEEGLSLNQPVKITSFPVNTSPLKVVDFRQITMKSDMPAGSEIRVTCDNMSQLVTPAGLAKAKTQLSKVITKDMVSVAKEMMASLKEDQAKGTPIKTYSKDNKTLSPRPILPKPSNQAEGSCDDGGVPVRIKQISRIGTTGVSEKVNVIEVIPKVTPPVYSTMYNKTQQLSSTPSTTTSNSPAVTTKTSRRGRKKHSRRSYYAYVTESETDTEMGGDYDRRRKKKRVKEDDVILDEKVVLSHRRSKRESLSQKLAEWGLLPSGSKIGIPDTYEDDDDRIPTGASNVVYQPPKRRRLGDEDEEEENEPVVPGPPPKFITVKSSSPVAAVESKDDEVQPLATAMEVDDYALGQQVLEENQQEQQQQQPRASPVMLSTLSQTHQDAVVKVKSAEDEAVQPIIKPEQRIKDEKNVIVQATATTTATQKTASTAGTWIKKACSMLAPPLSSTHQSPFTPKKKVDTMNKSLMCKPIMLTKATVCNPVRIHKATQTEENVVEHKKTVTVPLPVPLVMPVPGFPLSSPSFNPIPIPVPVIIPCPIPATRKAVMELIKKLMGVQPDDDSQMDPREAELLEIAEVISETKTQDDVDNETYNATIVRGVNDRNYIYPGTSLVGGSYNGRMGGGAGGEDVLEMAMRMAADMPEDPNSASTNKAHIPGYLESSRSELAMVGGQAGAQNQRLPLNGAKRGLLPTGQPLPVDDSRMTLKYSFALKAWKVWVEQKNQEITKTSGVGHNRRRLIFDSDPLRSSYDELNSALSMFVKDLRKATGENYSPDSIYFFCLGIQYYLKENNRQDNIFFDVPYQKFTDVLNEMLATFELRLNAQNLLICRVTEDHLWESMQLGCHSPQTLLNTLIYFNTKFFILDTVDAHLNLSFSSVERSSEINENRQVARKMTLKKTITAREIKLNSDEQFKQLENLDDLLKCPVKLFEFYLSKCPESMRNHTRLFYLTPDSTSRPDSIYWYSPMALSRGALTKMLNRIKVVKEIQITRLQHMQI